MSAISAAVQPRARVTPRGALSVAVQLWFAIAITGQLLFVVSVAVFYGRAALRRDWLAWNAVMPHGYVTGDAVGNSAVAIHLVAAVVIIASGALQLIPRVRAYAPAFHRWNGRLYILSAFVVSIAGIHMAWHRGSVGDVSQHVGITLNAVLVMAFAALALARAVQKRFADHRRWALRLFMAAGGVWFFRVMLFLVIAVFRGPVGFDPVTFTGPMLTALSFASYVLPLAVLELYLRAKSDRARYALAAAIVVLTLVMAAGIMVNTAGRWGPNIAAAFADRKSIAETLSVTVAAHGVEAAVQQYHDLTGSVDYAWEEAQLNTLGYQLLRAKRSADAIRIFELNVEAYPQSANAYDSLGEACVEAGATACALTNYRKALALDPKSSSARRALETLAPR